jgi:hypothetical protein
VSEEGREQLILKERGRGIMEAITVELTERWMKARPERSLRLTYYSDEKQVLNTLIQQLSQEHDMPLDAVFKRMVDAYFKPEGFKDLVEFIDGYSSEPKPHREHKYRTQILYALMEFEKEKNNRGYPLTRNFITNQLTSVQKAQISTFLSTYDSKNVNSNVQLADPAIEELRKVIAPRVTQAAA